MLPRFRAIRFEGITGQGRTKPILLECEAVDEDDQTVADFAVKAPGLPEVGDYELFVEALGCLLAAELEIETPLPALITIDEEFVQAVNPILKPHGLSITQGTGFGSKLIKGGVMATGHEYQNPEQLARARDIFCYDLLVQNPDRLTSNPNCMVKEGKYLPFDFNMAFSFLMLLGNSEEPWRFSGHRIYDTHLFLASLRGKDVDFKPFIDRVEKLNQERLEEILEAIPFLDGRWNEKVLRHLLSVVENAGKLELEYARCVR